MMLLRERITKRCGVILSKQSLQFNTEIASPDYSGPNRTPFRMTDRAGRSVLLPMTVHLGVFVIMIIALPYCVRAQLTRIDSVLAASLMPMVPSINGSQALLTGDSAYTPLFTAVQKAMVASAPLFYVSQLSANVQRMDSGKARMDISMQGELLQPMNPIAVSRILARMVTIDLAPSDWMQLQNNASRYVHYGAPQSGFWSNILEPIVVVLGAAAVVALFFLIRS
jgi:hypothetical protein